MALKNAFANLALDQSVMAATPLLKAINTTLLSTPYVYVVNETSQQVWLATPSTLNVNVINVSTPTATPIVQFIWPPFLQVWEATPAVRNVNIVNPSTPTATPIVVVAWQPPINVTAQIASGTQVWLATPSTVNVNIANPATPTATPIVVIASQPPITVTFPAIQNVNVANQATPTATPIVQFVWPNPLFVYDKSISSTPINVNIANPSTPPPVQPISGTVNIGSTPIVSLANTQVTVQNFPSTPIVQFIWPNPLFVYDKSISSTPINVNIANVSTPPAIQPVSGTVNIGSTPIVSLANTQVAVQNFPASQTISGTVNIGSTPIVSLANTQVTVQNFQATPIVQFVWPNPLFVYDKLISATPLNVNIANPSTPPPVQAVSGTVNIGSTPIVSLANTQVAVQNWPATQPVSGTVSIGSTPVVSLANTQVTVQNFQATPIVQFIWPNPLFVYDKLISATPLNVNIANPSTPAPVQAVSGTVSIGSTPVVSLANTQVAVQNFPANQTVSGTVSIGSTPIVSLANTQVVVQNNPLLVDDVTAPSTPVFPTGQGRSLKFANIGATVNGDNIITPGIASNRIKVVSYVLMASAAVNVRWGSSTPANGKTGLFPLVANSGVSAVGQVSSHLFETNSGESLSLTLDAAVNVGGHVSYFVEP